MLQTSSNQHPVTASGLVKFVETSAGRIDILQRIDLTVSPGEAVAILGASGSGKSTLLGLLAGLDEASSGEVRLFGTSLGDLDEDGRAALRAGKVGFVFQSFQLLSGMTALENVMLPLELAGERGAEAAAKAALTAAGLSQRLHHYPSQLSGGEQQRVALARAFAPDPQVLFADEPTANLDAHTGETVADLLFSLQEQSDTVLILVTHDEMLARRCDRRLYLRDGVLENGA
ncbi:MAG: ATP-binding cassette domain-containing protein [Candidatus Thiodiazotropha sp. (ex Ctena orbiculata)]|uniref:ATP-binding cassette domain-containing protein n=1 Tax=Candidatus Thiodiazotropha taylori TaxID=2792791 RepID=A0A944QUZ1_9GAMM|nr:ATP-binding cassette domain-containing protein [Candidatus Thiodiazotropha taylori]PUB88158.1 MAG: ABC transporter [gamma proteobacterium symbiont of Ctena orbiculata]MBT2989435.1 ATP-binding cassette domain-containing protein [Candidatus Thiodiazotropha taylori]MBT2997015.1 ATP-binding cassette domain-containing protein [Candidatus Thiodiazotropha taylori]MBT3000870.1 ATP-binding cassette domain-containing protein [Candidatus Thiodiazotropha taylori]